MIEREYGYDILVVMSGEMNTLHIPEQDALFKSILCIYIK